MARDERILGKCEELSVGVFRWQELQGSRHKVFSGYLVITRSTGNKSKHDRCKYLSIGIFRGKGIAKATAQGLERISESIFEIFWCSRRSSGLKGLSGRKYFRRYSVIFSRDLVPVAFAKEVGTKSREHRRVSSKSFGAPSNHLE